MTSDFENDEIQDTAFPVDFSDDGVSLDIYGVWVKSGPRDAAGKVPASARISEEPDSSILSEPALPVESESIPDELPELNDLDALPDLKDFPDLNDISDIPDIPDITDMPDMSVSEVTDPGVTETDVTESIVSENVMPDIADFAELPDVEDITSIGLDETDAPVAADLSEINFETIDLTPEIQPVLEEPEYMPTVEAGETSFNSVDMNDFLDEAPADATETVEVTAESTDAVQEEPFEAVNLDNLSFEAIQTDELGVTPDILDESPVSAEQAEPVQAGDSIDQIVEFSNEILDLPDEPREDVPEEEISLNELVTEEKAPAAEDDFSDFLSDLNAESAPSTGKAEQSDTLDLDSFIDSFNETGGTPPDKTEQLYDDVEPVDLELEFDESFIEDSEKIKATGASVSESEFFNSEFGVELIDETQTHAETIHAGESSDIDALLAESSLEMPEMAEKRDENAYEVTDEFDDLLSSLDSAPVHTQGSTEQKQTTQKQKTFDLTVTEEDSMDSPTAEIPAASDSDDFDISFTGGIVKEEKLDIPEIRDYNTPEPDVQPGPVMDVIEEPMFSEPMTPEFDDIRALEQELNEPVPDTGDETVVANDKSTELLMIIAEELSSIKNEITTLKSELSSFKAAGLTAETAVEAVPDVTGENSGFFSDDDTDETIALTGDELNNILITADFTEEKGESEELPDEGIPQSLDDISELIPPAESMNARPDEDTAEIPETLPDSIFDMPSITDVTPVEVAHVNKLEDDVSYLEGSDSIEPELSNVAIDESELEMIDFNDEKLEEPVLTEFNIDLSGIEDSLADEKDVFAPLSEPDATETVESIDIPLSDTVEQVPDITFDEPVLETAESVAEVSEPVTADIDETFDEPEMPVTAEPSVEEEVTVNTGSPERAVEGPMAALPVDLKNEIKSVLSYMDQLLESLPEDKIEEFAKSEHFEVYKKLFEELGIS